MKNLYRFELRRSLKALLVWGLCLAGLVCMGYLEFDLVFRSNADVTAIMDAIPPQLSTLLGITAHVDFSTAEGFFCLMADFAFYALSAYAALLGTGLLAREEGERTADFLYSRPCSRGALLAGKWLAGLTCCALLVLVTLAVCALSFGRAPELAGAIPAWGAGLLFTQCLYFAGGALVAACCRRPGRASAVTLLLLAATILAGKFLAMAGIDGGPALALSPRDYFPVERWLYGGGFGLWPWLLAGGGAAALFAAALGCYRRKDL